MVKEMLLKTGLKYETGYLYFVKNNDGQITLYRVKMERGGRKKK